MELKSGEVSWQSPSNIALIKYWGKKGFQLPANPSLSFTLSKSVTRTSMAFAPASDPEHFKVDRCRCTFQPVGTSLLGTFVQHTLFIIATKMIIA